MDEPCEEILKFSRYWIFTNVCIIQANIIASTSSTPACVFPSTTECSLSNYFSHSFGRSLNPFIINVRAFVMSYYTFFRGWLFLGKPPSSTSLPPLLLSVTLGALTNDSGYFLSTLKLAPIVSLVTLYFCFSGAISSLQSLP